MRRGTTLVETMVVVLIAVLLFTALYKLLMGGIRTGEEMTEEVALLVDVRAMVEHMTRDVAAAHVILPPESGDMKNTLTLARYASEDASDRMDANKQNKVYPFMEVTSTTTVKLNCNRVKYTWDKDKKELSRVEEAGMLDGKPGTNSGGQRDLKSISDYSFTADHVIPSPLKGPAHHITQFELSYMFYDDKDKGNAKLVGAPGDLFRTACVGLALTATQDTGLYARADGKTPSRRLPQIVLMTKFWSQRKLSEVMYPEYFSSADDDLRF